LSMLVIYDIIYRSDGKMTARLGGRKVRTAQGRTVANGNRG
jgi:hypothetical protein